MTEGQDPGKPGLRVYLVASGLISVAAGLLLALVAFGIVLVLAGSPTEGGYCSDSGIGPYEARTPEKAVAYIDEGWSGVPPRQHCRVYLASATDDSPPRRLLAEGAYPGTVEYAWVGAAFLLPFAFGCLLLAMAGFARQRGVPGD